MSDIEQRTQRLVTAIYFITGFFSDQEPIKWKLRSISSDLISSGTRDRIATVRDIVSLFSIAKNAGIVSNTNYEILFNELSKLENEIEKSFSALMPAMNKSLIEPKSTDKIRDNISEPLLEEKTSERIERPILKEFGAVSVKKNKRQSIIIGILKRKKEIMIKDITPLINGCSEKTIQRELGEMVSSGVLRKIGEKRWSRYTLA